MIVRVATVLTAILMATTAAQAAADARPRNSPAKGTKECVVGQYTSEFLSAKHAEE